MVRAFLHRCVLRFDAQLQRRPLGTQMVVGGLLTYFGDILAQQMLEKRGWDNHDWIRSFRMGCFSVFVWTGVGYKWYEFTFRIKIDLQFQFSQINVKFLGSLRQKFGFLGDL